MEQGISLHDADLRYQALRICREKNYLDEFKASPSWILRFKRDHRLCSRKITRFVSKKTFADKDKIDADAKKFVEDLKVSHNSFIVNFHWVVGFDHVGEDSP